MHILILLIHFSLCHGLLQRIYNIISSPGESCNSNVHLAQKFSTIYDSTVLSSKSCNFDDSFVECTSESSNTLLQLNYDTLDEQDAFVLESNSGDAIFNHIKGSFHLLKTWMFCSATTSNVVNICDEIDDLKFKKDYINMQWLKWRRWFLLSELLQKDRVQYLSLCALLTGRVERLELPNLQSVKLPNSDKIIRKERSLEWDNLVEDCYLPNAIYNETWLDMLLLSIFRRLVQNEIGFTSPLSGIKGLLDEARHYKLSDEGQVNDSRNQHLFVQNVLSGLLTPVIPPVYRLFMSGVVPSLQNGDPKWLVEATEIILSRLPESFKIKYSLELRKQIGPMPYAPFLTSLVTPPFMRFLLGPSRLNRRKDGRFGGMIVEKCRFLQESNCKGLCLHQCKIPAQEFFKETLHMDLTVSPNFETQECQWSWGEKPIHHSCDPDFPKGCIAGCETRKVAL